MINDLYCGNQDKIHSALAALNRLYDLAGDAETIQKIGQFLTNNKVEKMLLASTIRTIGEEGENYLIHELENTKDNFLKIAIISVLSYRRPKKPAYLKIKLENRDYNDKNKLYLPGSFCKYIGNNYLSIFFYTNFLYRSKQPCFHIFGGQRR